MDIGQLELRPHREFFDQELKIVIARERNDFPIGIGGAPREASSPTGRPVRR